MIIAAATMEAAMKLAQRSDRPTDLGPAKDPERAAAGWRRWGFAPKPAAVANASEVLAKVRKLLALASNGAATEGEATNAAAAAQRLITQHRLDVAMLDSDTEADPEPATGYHDPLDADQKRIVRWKGSLARTIAAINGCKTYWTGGALMIIGAPSDVASVRHLYVWLAREIDRLGRDAAVGRGRSYGRGWRIGCAERVAERLSEAAAAGRKAAKAEALASGTALVRVESALARVEGRLDASNAWARRYLKLTATRSTPAPISALSAGRRAGDRIKLDGHAALGRGIGRLGGGK